jgi:osmotically-inducible protein OsmY
MHIETQHTLNITQPGRNCPMKNDIQIQQDVLVELGHDQDVIAGTIGVEVHHGVVKLAGHVSNFALRNRSELAAGRVDGVTNVVMDIDVTGAGAASEMRGHIAHTAPTV